MNLYEFILEEQERCMLLWKLGWILKLGKRTRSIDFGIKYIILLHNNLVILSSHVGVLCFKFLCKLFLYLYFIFVTLFCQRYINTYLGNPVENLLEKCKYQCKCTVIMCVSVCILSRPHCMYHHSFTYFLSAVANDRAVGALNLV